MNTHNNQNVEGAHKPTMGEKLSGKVEELMGKATKNPEKIAEGEAKQAGQPVHSGVGATGTHNTSGTHGVTGTHGQQGQHGGITGSHTTHGSDNAYTDNTYGTNATMGGATTTGAHGQHGTGFGGNTHSSGMTGHNTNDPRSTTEKIADKMPGSHGSNTNTGYAGDNYNSSSNTYGTTGAGHNTNSGFSGNNDNRTMGEKVADKLPGNHGSNTNTGYGGDNYNNQGGLTGSHGAGHNTGAGYGGNTDNRSMGEKIADKLPGNNSNTHGTHDNTGLSHHQGTGVIGGQGQGYGGAPGQYVQEGGAQPGYGQTTGSGLQGGLGSTGENRY